MAQLLAAALSGITLLLSLAFAGLVLSLWAKRRKRHQALWAAALLLFALASAIEVQAYLGAWGAATYKAYFVITAVMVGLMAAGTGYLVSRRLGDVVAVYVFVLGFAMAVFVGFAAADAARLADASASGAVPTQVLGSVRLFHPLLDVPAALLLIAAPLLNWWRTRAAATLLIALGAVVFTVMHSLASGAQTGAVALTGAAVFSAGTLAGVVLLFAGYVKSREAPRGEARPQAVATGG